MKKNNKILNKIITGFLAFAMVITGAMSLGTMKKHTASADELDVPMNLLEDLPVYYFAYNMVMNMEFHDGLESCFIIDSEFLLSASISDAIDYIGEDEIPMVAFLAGFKEGLRERFVPDEPGINPEDYSLAGLLETVQMKLFVYDRDTNRCYNLQTGAYRLAFNHIALMGFTGLDINNNPYYAAIVYPYDTGYYNVLLSLQQQKQFAVYMFSAVNVTLSGTGLIMKCYLISSDFTSGCEWEI